ncbi:MAG: hypothetical protein PHY80_03615 [Rickettsiales bacterium]|nr:hypothetical protein [Rickettsiales bacterium]
MTPNRDLEIYDKLNGYYDIVDGLTTEVNESEEINIKQKQEVLYPIIDEIKVLADVMVESYVIYLKDKKNLEQLENVQDNINNILEKIDYFKNKIYEVYRINNLNKNE